MLEKLPAAQLYGQVRVGRVASVDKKTHTLEVKFEEIDGVTIKGLQILVTRPGDYSLYATDTPVLCLLLEGWRGVGFVLGAFYTEKDAPPLDDDGARAIVGDDIRLGDADASDKIALAPKTNDNFDTIWSLLDGVFGSSSPALATPAPGGPDPVYAALKAAIAVKQLAGDLPPADVSAENVSAK